MTHISTKRKRDGETFTCAHCENTIPANKICKSGKTAKNHGYIRCLQCALPKCRICDKSPSAPLNKPDIVAYFKESGGHWYCKKRACQKEKLRKCKACGQYKKKGEFNERYSDKRCTACQFPTCRICQTKFSQASPIKKGDKGLSAEGWLCVPCRRERT